MGVVESQRVGLGFVPNHAKGDSATTDDPYSSIVQAEARSRGYLFFEGFTDLMSISFKYSVIFSN